MTLHELKTVQPYFGALQKDLKTFEIRRADREFQVGDELKLSEYDGEAFTGNFVRRDIKAVYVACPGVKPGYVVLVFT